MTATLIPLALNELLDRHDLDHSTLHLFSELRPSSLSYLVYAKRV